tara:strand:+ start:1403 stop:2203 length:801 start_codon:yes stop_codon:yes gene_type:complete
MSNKQQFNKKYYEDVLNYASSLPSTNEVSLSPFEVRVLRKLIHIGNTNPKITYSNENLSKLLYCPDSVKTIKKVIPKLVKKKYIKSISSVISDGKSINKRRVININWEKIEEVFNILPNYFIDEEDTTPIAEVVRAPVPSKEEQEAAGVTPGTEPTEIDLVVTIDGEETLVLAGETDIEDIEDLVYNQGPYREVQEPTVTPEVIEEPIVIAEATITPTPRSATEVDLYSYVTDKGFDTEQYIKFRNDLGSDTVEVAEIDNLISECI